jgi:hypothetical protein
MRRNGDGSGAYAGAYKIKTLHALKSNSLPSVQHPAISKKSHTCSPGLGDWPDIRIPTARHDQLVEVEREDFPRSTVINDFFNAAQR